MGSPLGRLTAEELAPGDVSRPGATRSQSGATSRSTGSRVLRALDVPAGQFVELRTLIPSAFTSTAGMRVERATALEKIVAEERDDAAAYEQDQRKIDDALDNLRRDDLEAARDRLLPALLVIGASSGAGAGSEGRATTASTSRSRPPRRSRRSCHAARQGGEAGSLEFTATLFDLIRRGRLTTTQVTTERKIWGGLRSELADLELSLGDVEALEPWEAPVAHVVEA